MRLLTCIFLLIPCCLYGAEIYKSVDEEGNVTYTDEPPASGNTEIIEPPPEPDAEQVNSAIEREQQLEQSLDTMEAEGRESEGAQQPGESDSSFVFNEGGVIFGGPGVRRGDYARGARTAPGARTADGAQTAGGPGRVQHHGTRR